MRKENDPCFAVQQNKKRTKEEALLDLLKLFGPTLIGRAFAINDTCVGALFYQTLLSSTQQLSFAIFREAYDQLVADLMAVASQHGCVISQKGYFLVRLPGPAQEALAVYPLDALPEQVTLRFRLFSEARSRIAKGEDLEPLRRYNGNNSGVYAILSAPQFGDKKIMGERNIFERSIIRSRIEPLREGMIDGVPISLPNKSDNWAVEMTEARTDAISVIHAHELDLLQHLDQVTQQLGTSFFLVGGTLLGAIRENGFIPWDDDLDIGMLRKDYKRFCKNAQEHLPENYFVQLPSTDAHSQFVYARLRNEDMKYVTYYSEGKDTAKGIWADIFPFDATPKNRFLSSIQRKGAHYSARISMGLTRRREYAHYDEELDVSFADQGSFNGQTRDADLAQKALLEADRRYLQRYKMLSRFFPIRLTRGGYNLFARCFNPFLAGRKNSRYACFIPTYTTIEAGESEPLQRVQFETLCFPVFSGAQSFLERQYGAYMDRPAQHERESSHGLKYLQFKDGRKQYV